MTPSVGHPLAPPIVEAPTADATTLAPSPPLIFVVQKVTLIAAEIILSVAMVGSIVVPSYTVVAPLSSAGVATTSASVVLPPSSSAPMVLPSTVLAVASPSSSSHPRVFLDHLYTSSDADSLWGATYKPK